MWMRKKAVRDIPTINNLQVLYLLIDTNDIRLGDIGYSYG
jgi:hypothetical protein